VFWLFPRPPVPIVITASLLPPGAPGSDAIPTLRRAVRAASEQAPGGYVAFGTELLSPVNLKFERMTAGGFRNWNLSRACHTADPLFDDPPLADRQALQGRLEAAIDSSFLLRVYPGMRVEHVVELMDRGVKNFVLELYDTGTANLRDSPYSLRRALAVGRERGVRFFCTSQQEGIVDFSGYATSHALWREGAIPMGALTTESAWTKLVVCSAFGERDEDLVARMESGNANACL
jgi:aspartyl-tRNA(Asn)/glutamyl-tRNA(Gln) amidotransferase subunit B